MVITGAIVALLTVMLCDAMKIGMHIVWSVRGPAGKLLGLIVMVGLGIAAAAFWVRTFTKLWPSCLGRCKKHS